MAFFAEADTKKHASAKTWNAALVNLLIESLKMIMWLIVCCFSVSDKHGQKNNVIWLSTTWLLIFRTQVANKKPLLTKPANWNFLVKRYNFSRLQNLYPIPGCYTGKMLFADASKIIRNWFLTLQPDNYLQFTKVGTKKGMDVIWALDAITYLFMH